MLRKKWWFATVISTALIGTLATAVIAISPAAGAPAVAGQASKQAGSVRAQAGWRTFRNLNSGKCLGTWGGGASHGTPVVQYRCNGHDDQYWEAIPLGDNYYREIHNGASGLCLGVIGGSIDKGAQLVIAVCDGTLNQEWTATAHGTSWVLWNENSAMIIGVAGQSKDDLAAVVQWPWEAHPDQSWY